MDGWATHRLSDQHLSFEEQSLLQRNATRGQRGAAFQGLLRLFHQTLAGEVSRAYLVQHFLFFFKDFIFFTY